MAFVGANDEFLFVVVFAQESASDGGVFRKTTVWEAIENSTLNLPEPNTLPQNSESIFEDTSDAEFEYFFVCNDAFSLGLHIMKHFSKRNLTAELRVFQGKILI